MFVEHARMAKSTFRLTAENAADVVQLCRRLDGLPLAIELAAARANLLNPAALLARLDKALDIASRGTRGPSRQQTLRDTIAWSYALLTGPQQAFFRRLAVFAGGADLDAISALTTNDLDPLDLVADLVDASLIISTDGVAGEPRFDMLETIRAYAYDELRSNGELHELRRNHAEYFVAVAQGLRPLLSGRGDQRLEARSRFELELDNVREALSWTLGADSNGASSAGDAKLGLQLCAELTLLWEDSGYFAEERQWLERAINTDVEESKELGLCQVRLARLLILQGDVRRAYVAATHSVRTWRRLDDKAGLSGALAQLGRCEQLRGNMGAAREAFEESVLLAHRAKKLSR
jgi:predicted ATPase